MLSTKFSKFILLGASMVALAACGNGETIASGNNVKVTNEELVKVMKAEVGDSILSQMILTDIFENVVGADKAKELKTNAEAETANMMAQYGGEDAFLNVLAQSGFTSTDSYTRTSYYYKLMSEAVGTKVEVTDDEVKKAYESYEPGRDVSHILVADEDTANEVIKKLNEGGDFATLAKEYSSDSSAANGGSLGTVSKGQMVETFEKEAFALKEGEYSKTPVKSDYGYHIVFVTKATPKGTLEEEKEQLTEAIRQTKLQDATFVQSTISGFVKDANVKISDEELKGAMDAYKPVEDKTDESKDAAASDEKAAESAASEESSK